MRKNSRTRILILISLFVVSIDSYAQVGKVTILKIDFGLNSTYYLSNMNLKLKIFNYLNKIEDRSTSINSLLLDECIVTKQKAFPATDSINDITSQLNTLGTLTYCITGISDTGDINYRIAQSSNLNIVLDEGALKR